MDDTNDPAEIKAYVKGNRVNQIVRLSQELNRPLLIRDQSESLGYLNNNPFIIKNNYVESQESFIKSVIKEFPKMNDSKLLITLFENRFSLHNKNLDKLEKLQKTIFKSMLIEYFDLFYYYLILLNEFKWCMRLAAIGEFELNDSLIEDKSVKDNQIDFLTKLNWKDHKVKNEVIQKLRGAIKISDTRCFMLQDIDHKQLDLNSVYDPRDMRHCDDVWRFGILKMDFTNYQTLIDKVEQFKDSEIHKGKVKTIGIMDEDIESDIMLSKLEFSEFRELIIEMERRMMRLRCSLGSERDPLLSHYSSVNISYHEFRTTQNIKYKILRQRFEDFRFEYMNILIALSESPLAIFKDGLTKYSALLTSALFIPIILILVDYYLKN